MSAINPASFASPSLGLQAPSGIGPGAVGVARSAQVERRAQPDQSYASQQTTRSSYQNAFAQPFTPSQDRVPNALPAAFQPSGYTYGYSQFTGAPRTVGVTPNSYVPMVDSFAAYQAAEYQGLPGRYPSPHATPTHDGDYSRQSSGLGTPNEWISSFQGLSMNTR